MAQLSNIGGGSKATENQQAYKINGFYGQHSWVFGHGYFTRYKVGEVIRHHSQSDSNSVTVIRKSS